MKDIYFNINNKSNLIVCKNYGVLAKRFDKYVECFGELADKVSKGEKFIQLKTGNVYQFVLAVPHCHGIRVDAIYIDSDVDYEIRDTIFVPCLKPDGVLHTLYD